jgi:hypothetical protein
MMHQFAVGLNNADEKVNIAEDKKNDPINADPAVADN